MKHFFVLEVPKFQLSKNKLLFFVDKSFTKKKYVYVRGK